MKNFWRCKKVRIWHKVISEDKFLVTQFGITRKINENIVKVVTESKGFEYT